jgi:hypothetical protein
MAPPVPVVTKFPTLCTTIRGNGLFLRRHSSPAMARWDRFWFHVAQGAKAGGEDLGCGLGEHYEHVAGLHADAAGVAIAEIPELAELVR